MLSFKQIIDATKGNYINGNKQCIIKNYVIDSRDAKSGDFFAPIVGSKSDGHEYILNCVKNGIYGYFIESSTKNKDEIIKKSIIINKNICIVEITKSEDALYEIAKYNRSLHMDIPVVAVTGSVGKTSTREMISSILSQKYNLLSTYKNFNGYLGLSLMLLKLENQQIAVLEHGIDKIGEMDKLAEASKPNVAVVTMIGTAHIGIIGSQENIFKEKLNITKYMNKNCSLILNNDDKYLNKYTNNNISVIRYSLNDVRNINTANESLSFETNIYDENSKIILNEIGEHNIYNALAGIKVAELFNIEKNDIIKGIAVYRNISRRFEKIELAANIKIVDDTYNASIDSMKSGIKAIAKIDSKRKIAVLGDMLELGDYTDVLHTEVGKVFKDEKVDIVFTLGDKAKLIAEEAKKHVGEVYSYNIKGELIGKLRETIKSGDLIYFKASNGMNFNQIIDDIKKYIENNRI